MYDSELDRNRRRLGKADDELSAWFTASVGVRAQSYQSAGSAFDSDSAHAERLRALRSGTMAWFDRVLVTIGQLPIETRRLLSLVYMPHGWPTWLASAFSPPWGGGNYVALAATLPRAILAARGASPIEHFLSRGINAGDALVRSLKDDCEVIRVPALEAYNELRVERVMREQVAEREAKELRAARNAALLEEKLGMQRRRARARYERRLRRAS